MARSIEFKISQIGGVTSLARGFPIIFPIGDRKIKFVIQYDTDTDKLKYLTHYASGYKFGSLDDAAVELMCKFSTYHRFRKRELAEFLIQKAITKFGAEKVLEKLDAVPVINSEE